MMGVLLVLATLASVNHGCPVNCCTVPRLPVSIMDVLLIAVLLCVRARIWIVIERINFFFLKGFQTFLVI
jgi:hypothetical protein